ncbi:hypothetical protein NDU88_006704 [Pleurodeles waltl]|uniref:Uncharacterized protein n=1 Tax=Pleurodeles waltl TaxID=8319 RepID=A0AAV7X1F2_PLEWA|nr:hypothetical protein NDU88_006704 [Pleurodeles waltl]
MCKSAHALERLTLDATTRHRIAPQDRRGADRRSCSRALQTTAPFWGPPPCPVALSFRCGQGAHQEPAEGEPIRNLQRLQKLWRKCWWCDAPASEVNYSVYCRHTTLPSCYRSEDRSSVLAFLELHHTILRFEECVVRNTAGDDECGELLHLPPSLRHTTVKEKPSGIHGGCGRYADDTAQRIGGRQTLQY